MSEIHPTRIMSSREEVLSEAIHLTTGDRNQAYGRPYNNLALQGRLWELYKMTAGEKYNSAHDAAMQLILAKIARIACGEPGRRDNYVDGAAYFGIAYECYLETAEQTEGVPRRA